MQRKIRSAQNGIGNVYYIEMYIQNIINEDTGVKKSEIHFRGILHYRLYPTVNILRE